MYLELLKAKWWTGRTINRMEVVRPEWGLGGKVEEKAEKAGLVSCFSC